MTFGGEVVEYHRGDLSGCTRCMIHGSMDGWMKDRGISGDWSEWSRTRSIVAPRDTSIDHGGGLLWPVCQIVEARFIIWMVVLYGIGTR